MVRNQRILIVDDHPVVRRGLRSMLEAEDWVDEVAEAETVAQAVTEAVTGRVDVVAMDIGLPDGDGVEATRKILQARPQVKILVVTMVDDEDAVSRALRAGARGYMLKGTDPDTLVDALCTVAGGGLVLGPDVGPSLLAALQGSKSELPPPLDKLTPRERDILTRLAAGESNVQIARRLGLSDKTVRNQLSVVFTKLGVAGRVQAALLARDAGMA
jgi:two-component system, NarL family, nitrate/nitrite response regulator NarL